MSDLKSPVGQLLPNIPMADDEPPTATSASDDDDANPTATDDNQPDDEAENPDDDDDDEYEDATSTAGSGNRLSKSIESLPDDEPVFDEAEEKARLISQVLELQNTLDDLSQKVDSVKEENLRLKSENQVLAQYMDNLMVASSVFQSTVPVVVASSNASAQQAGTRKKGSRRSRAE